MHRSDVIPLILLVCVVGFVTFGLHTFYEAYKVVQKYDQMYPAIPKTSEQKAEESLRRWEAANVVNDPRTGCQYLRYGRELTVRVDAQGKPICRKN